MEFKKEFEYAQKIIKEAGRIILTQYTENNDISFKSDDSWVTKVDLEVESFLHDNLLLVNPTYGFIGEERYNEVKNISWIVDPIDGTVAFTRHIPEFGIAIALKKDRGYTLHTT